MLIHSLLVGIGGFFGAISRFTLSNVFQKQHSFPYGTMIVNIIGSFLLGVIAGSNFGNTIYLLIGTGFMGAFTTFSTMSLDLVKLWENKQWKFLIVYFSLTYIGGVTFAFIGFIIVTFTLFS